MKLTFLGATHEVTGSCYYLEAAGRRVVIDCGMEQGPNMYENQELPVAPGEVDFLLLTHAHIDHSGLIPLLYHNGFQGEIHTTAATGELCGIMLRDSAHIQEFEAEWRNRKAKRAGREAYIPLYTMADAEGALRLFRTHGYREMIDLCPGIRVRFIDVGHLLGSASIEVWATEGDVTKKIVFSGDIGNVNIPLIRDPSYIEEADYVLTESTYGDRNHESPGDVDYPHLLSEIIQKTFDRGGNVVIPAFAVGRTQELLYHIREIKAKRLVTGHGEFAVYVDSPMAVEATNVFCGNIRQCLDKDALALANQGISPISFEGLKLSVTTDDSKAINADLAPKVIISASGMCDAGRIRHHLKHNLWRPECSVVFVGFQAVGTLGRYLLGGAKSAKLFGEEIEIKAEILNLPGMSGHADQEGLLRWIRSFKNKPERVFVVHGDSEVVDLYTERLKSELGLDAVAPYSGTQYDLLTNTCLYEAQPVPIEKKQPGQAAHPSPAYDKLLAAQKAIAQAVAHNVGSANKDLAAFAAELEALVKKYGR